MGLVTSVYMDDHFQMVLTISFACTLPTAMEFSFLVNMACMELQVNSQWVSDKIFWQALNM